MTTVRAPSQFADAAAAMQGEWAGQGHVALPIGLADVSGGARWGCKGPGATAWMQTMGLSIPSAPNSWLPLQGGGLIARLGFTEYLVEGPANLVERLQAAPRAAGVYPVVRQDAVLLLGGLCLNALLRETCSVDFRAFFATTPALAQRATDPARTAGGEALQSCSGASDSPGSIKRPVILTSMVGVGVTIIPEWRAARPLCRIWCDGTYGHYLWETLLEVATSLGGGRVAAHDLMDSSNLPETLYDPTTCGAQS